MTSPLVAEPRAGLCDRRGVCFFGHMLEAVAMNIQSKVYVPVKHDPLCRRCDAIMAVIEGRQPRQNGVVVVSHCTSCGAARPRLDVR